MITGIFCPKCGSILYFLVLLLLCLTSCAKFPYYPIANVSTSWINSPNDFIGFTDGSRIRPILLRGNSGPRFACGFFCNGSCDSFLFAIFIVLTDSTSLVINSTFSSPQVVWSANRNHPVAINATLQLKLDGDFVLQDADGSIVWSTDTRGANSVAGLNLTDWGNLVLFDDNSATVWQSFDYPTDCLLPGQKFTVGQKITPSVSPTNWTELAILSVSVTGEGLIASAGSNPVQVYFNYAADHLEFTFLNGSFELVSRASVDSSFLLNRIHIPASSVQYMRFGSDGHLRVYEWRERWKEAADIFTGEFLNGASVDECSYPTVCGSYGICTDGDCTCPPMSIGGSENDTYFQLINDTKPNLGCSATVPLSCEASEYHSFLEISNTTYFTFQADYEKVDLETCKMICSKNCSCKAVIFNNSTSDPATGSCFLPSQIFSLRKNNSLNESGPTVYVKVQNVTNVSDGSTADPQRKQSSRVPIILGSSIGSFTGLLIFTGIIVLLVWKKGNDDEDEEDYLDQVPGTITRFSYEDLKAMTENFTKVLGKGGFGSVFEGTLADGTKIAVKRLDGLGQVRKSFLTEVKAIGSLHHVNLVRLLGFSADKIHRLLVYEFMSNGSLDKWIFNKTCEFVLSWQERKKIILDIAKGLTYLHEDCSQKIIHLDIKPQNILLDDNFNAKISDFGLSKLIDRGQSKTVTNMRGTPGYLAPEWLSLVITEKVDIYSFGVVVLEILCGRGHFDRSQPEERTHLLTLFEKKARENRLLDLVDEHDEDMQLHEAEIIKIMKLAACCLQSDYAKRPAMSLVVNVLEGVMEVENLDFNLSNLPLQTTLTVVTQLLPSVLSGPR